jgi:hypothetical protein
LVTSKQNNPPSSFGGAGRDSSAAVPTKLTSRTILSVVAKAFKLTIKLGGHGNQHVYEKILDALHEYEKKRRDTSPFPKSHSLSPLKKANPFRVSQ